MPDLIKPGFARKAVVESTKGFTKLPKVLFVNILNNKYVQDFFFYVILVCAILFICSLLVFFGWNTCIVDVFSLRPMSFVDALGGVSLLLLLFAFMFGLKESK